MTDKSALFFDVDGTLMGDGRYVPESTKAAIKKAREKGHYVFINSGRILPLARYIKNYVECDGLLCGCGTDLYIGDKNIYSFELPEDILDEVREECRKDRGDLVLEGPKGVAFAPWIRINEVVWLLDLVKDQDALWTGDFYDRSYVANKFCMQYDKETDLGSFRVFAEKYFDVIERSGDFYECVPKGHGKAYAVKKIMEILDILKENIYVFGDSTNDLDMIRFAEHSVVMGKHDKELEPYAEFITRDLEDDGIEYAMKHYGLI